MTLSELLHSVSFDDLIPTLKEVYGVETDIYAYREAFDELNLLRPIGRDDGNIKVYRDEEEHYIGVSGCNDIWENLLDLNIHVEEGIRLDDNALAAYILWELTFYGFSQEEQSSFIENLGRPDNKYSKRASELYSRKISMYARGRLEKREPCLGISAKRYANVSGEGTAPSVCVTPVWSGRSNASTEWRRLRTASNDS